MWLTCCFDQGRGDRTKQILRNQPHSSERAGTPVQVGTGGGGIPRWHPLREQSRDQAGQHITRPRGGKPRRCRGVDGNLAVGRRNDRVGALQQYCRTGVRGGAAHRGDTILPCATERAGELAKVAEIRRGIQLIDKLQEEDGASADEALRYFCRVMLNLNEFIYLD